MRDIKFRGKRIDNGEWVYGYYAISAGNHYILDEKDATPWIVDPETVGQYTGIKDKNGVEIYEGDIYQNKDAFPGWMSMPLLIGYNEEYAQFKGQTMKDLGFIFNVFSGDPKGIIIGNRTDNQELLREGG